MQAAILAKKAYFNPRSPHGERRGVVVGMTNADDFNPRSPHGERQGEETAG